MRKPVIKILSAFLACFAAVAVFAFPAFSLSWDGSSSGGGGGGSPAGPKGYAIRYTDDRDLVGYRFSAVDKNGANKVTKVIDVFLNTDFGNFDYDGVYKFSQKYNKKQLIGNQNGGFSTVLTSVNCYREAAMNFATPLPVPSGMETWQNNTTNLNRVLSALGVGSLSNLKNGDKIIVEPIWSVRLESIFHALTVTEIAVYGKYILGAYSDGGESYTSESWGFISEYTNRHFPNALFTPNGQGLWAGVSAAASRQSFYNLINKGYGAGIAYTETRSDFSPTLSVIECRAYKGVVNDKTFHYGTSTGNSFANWTYVKGYPAYGDKIFYCVRFGKETENTAVKQTVWVDGVQVDERIGYSDSLEWFNITAKTNTVPASKKSFTVKARVDWIKSDGTLIKTGAEKTFYVPVKPVVTREKVSAFNEESVVQAYSGSAGSGGKLYFGQKVTFQYKYGATTTWESSNNVRATADRWNGSSWAHIYTKTASGEDVSQDSVKLSKTKSYTKNSGIGTYTIPLPAKNDTNSKRLRFYMTTAWASDTGHTLENNTYYLPVVKSDVELADIKLVDEDGNYADPTDLEVNEKVTVRYFYKNNTDCKVYVKGYSDDGSQISGVFAIPAGGTIEVEGDELTVPDTRTFSVWGGVYLDTVAKGNTDYETNGSNNTKTLSCRTRLPLSLTSIAPNAAYREKTTVISSFKLSNYTWTQYTPDKGLKVRLRIYKEGADTPFKTLTKDTVVPVSSWNLVYFSWKVPSGLKGGKVRLDADIYLDGEYHNLISDERATIPYSMFTTPDTQYEENAPSGFSIPSKPTGSSSAASWWIYEYENGGFVKKTYKVALSKASPNKIEPATGNTASKSGGVWTMKSGYGISIQSRILINNSYNGIIAAGNSYTLPQYAYVLLPEYNYVFADGKSITLNKVSGEAYSYFEFPELHSYGKIHFTPLWFPDGSYTVKIVQSDCWTPSGMIKLEIVPGTIKISGNAYDDWYAGRR